MLRGNLRQVTFSTEKARRLLGWQPKMSLARASNRASPYLKKNWVIRTAGRIYWPSRPGTQPCFSALSSSPALRFYAHITPSPL
ncbi:MAG: hypothetical protein IPK52_19900 [Chloroflexi bacterium]|nr:hypothetical protein [Chloroflexota bacterium]